MCAKLYCPCCTKEVDDACPVCRLPGLPQKPKAEACFCQEDIPMGRYIAGRAKQLPKTDLSVIKFVMQTTNIIDPEEARKYLEDIIGYN